MKLVTKINNTVPELSVKGFIDPRDGLLTIKVKKNSHAFSDGKVNIVVNCDYEPEEPKDNVRRELIIDDNNQVKFKENHYEDENKDREENNLLLTDREFLHDFLNHSIWPFED